MNSARKLYIGAFLACVGAMLTAWGYFQHYLGLEPCPLCILQRIVVIAMALLYLIAAVQNPAGFGRRIYAFLFTLVSLIGMGVSARHVWLQHLPPDQIPECGPGLDYLMDILPLDKVLGEVLTGSGECAEIAWRFFGLSIPAWTFVMFALFTLFNLRLLFVGPANRRIFRSR